MLLIIDSQGGAIYVRGRSTPLFDGCEFKNNFQTFDDNTEHGGERWSHLVSIS